MENLSTKDEQFLSSYNLTNDTALRFFTRETRLFLIFMVITFGGYQFYWFYKNWAAVRDATKQKMSPFWRTFFSIFYAWPLFKIMYLTAKKQRWPESLSPGWLAVIYILIATASGSSGRNDTSYNVAIPVISIMSALLIQWILQRVQSAAVFSNNSGGESQTNFPKPNSSEIQVVVFFTILAVLSTIAAVVAVPAK